MREGEYKLRQKEAGNPNLTPAQLRDVGRLLEGGTSKKMINILFGTSYQQLKALKSSNFQ